MGQKTHPVGYRLSVNKKWKSNWFANKNNFSGELEEDLRIRKYLNLRLPNAGISLIEISRTSKKVTIGIYTARPGIVIGRGGEEVNRLKKELRQLTGKKDAQVNISEVKRPELNAALVGSNIPPQKKKKKRFHIVVSLTKQYRQQCVWVRKVLELTLPADLVGWKLLEVKNLLMVVSLSIHLELILIMLSQKLIHNTELLVLKYGFAMDSIQRRGNRC